MLTLACTSQPRSTVLRGGTLIDGAGGGPIEDAALVVADGRILCVGANADCPTPAGAKEIDAEGFWIVPGLIDAYAEFDQGADRVRNERDLRLSFLLGVTAVRAAGTAERLSGNPVSTRPTNVAPQLPLARYVAGIGPEFIDLAAVARRLGTRPTRPNAIAPSTPADTDDGIVLRSRWADIDADSVRMIARTVASSGLALVPLLATEARWADPYRIPIGLHRLLELPLVSETLARSPIPDMSEETRARMRRAVAHMKIFVRSFHEAGGLVAAGSGRVIAPGLAIHAEMAALVGAGLSNDAALAAATRDAASFAGVEDSLGTLEPGKVADFLVLEGDPLADIANTSLVARVAKGGRLHDPASLLDDLTADLRTRTTGSALRLVVGAGAVVLVSLLTAAAIRRHARKRAARSEGRAR